MILFVVVNKTNFWKSDCEVKHFFYKDRSYLIYDSSDFSNDGFDYSTVRELENLVERVKPKIEDYLSNFLICC